MNTQLSPPHLVVPPHVDFVLDEIGQDLQITPTQFARAERAYRTVGEWLSADESPLAGYRPEVYPQGSMALRTTVRPLHEEEFDLDSVVEVNAWSGRAMELYNVTGERLMEHGDYRDILQPKNRCWRLNYAGQFHLDALPGREDPARDGSAIEIPDRALQCWKPTNPRDYALWFEHQAEPYTKRCRSGRCSPSLPPPPSTPRILSGEPFS